MNARLASGPRLIDGPDALHRVEVRGVSGQLEHPQPRWAAVKSRIPGRRCTLRLSQTRTMFPPGSCWCAAVSRSRYSCQPKPCSRPCGPGTAAAGRSAGCGRRAGSRPARPSRPPEPPPRTRMTGVIPRRPQVLARGGLSDWPVSSSKTIQPPRAAAVLLPAARSPSSTPRSRRRPARPPGGRPAARSSRAGAAGTRSRGSCTAP